jgi:replicative DNA helicase
MAVHPEALLISAVIQSGEYQHLAAEGISRNLFHVHIDEMEWLEQYIATHSKAPSKAAIRQQFPEFVIYKVDDTKHWCGEVRKEHKRQSVINLMDQVMNHLDSDDEEHALSTLETGLLDIRTSSSGVNPDFDVFDDWESVYGVIQDRVDRVRATGMAGIPTGFTTFDSITGGLQGGWFGVIAARLGQGKTWTGIRMAWAAAFAGHPVTYFSLEQSKFQIATRIHAFASREYSRGKSVFNPLDLNRGQGFDIREYKKFLQDMQSKKGTRAFYINDTSRGLVTPSTIASVIQTRQPAVVFIDYLTLLGTSGDDWRGTAKLSSELQSTAQRFNIPIVALSQVNRLGGMGGEPPGAEHLSQADAIGQDADFVLTMAQKSPRVTKMRLAKFRHGPGGDSWMTKFSPGTGEYEEISDNDAQDLIEEDQEVD